MRARWMCAALFLLTVVTGAALDAAALRPQTLEAFNKYVAETERQAAPSLATADGFLWIDGARPAAVPSLRDGAIVVEKMDTKFSGKSLDVRDGLIHHWLATGFVKGVTVDKALTVLQDF